MPAIPGVVPITGIIGPTSDGDSYAVIDMTYALGGWRVVANLAERDAIPIERRQVGMKVYVQGDVEYQLGSDFSTWIAVGGGSIASGSGGILDGGSRLETGSLYDGGNRV